MPKPPAPQPSPRQKPRATNTASVQPVEPALAEAAQTAESADADFAENEKMPTSDPTAELLGTTKRKRMARPPVPPSPRTRRAAPAKKTAAPKAATARRPSRAKKT